MTPLELHKANIKEALRLGLITPREALLLMRQIDGDV